MSENWSQRVSIGNCFTFLLSSVTSVWLHWNSSGYCSCSSTNRWHWTKLCRFGGNSIVKTAPPFGFCKDMQFRDLSIWAADRLWGLFLRWKAASLLKLMFWNWTLLPLRVSNASASSLTTWAWVWISWSVMRASWNLPSECSHRMALRASSR